MPTQIQRGCKRIQLCQKTPFGRKTLSTHMNSDTRLLPTALTRDSLRNGRSLHEVYLRKASLSPHDFGVDAVSRSPEPDDCQLAVSW